MSNAELSKLLADSKRSALADAGFVEQPWARWIEATLALDSRGLDDNLQQAWDNWGPTLFLDNVLAPFLRRVGDMWMNGQLGVVHEHFMSERVRIFLANRWREASDEATGPMVICTALPGEHHVLGLHMAAVVVALAGMRVTFLGHDTPIGSVRDAAVSVSARAVIVSISIASDRSTAHALLERMRAELPPEILLLAGGAGAPPEVRDTRIFDSVTALQDWALHEA